VETLAKTVYQAPRDRRHGAASFQGQGCGQFF